FNTIRVWGGGHYPSDDFYDACDEYGLLVWEDFMFACAHYRFTPEFEENISAEIIDNVKRLRHHASLALWCGNNEMEMFTDQGNWVLRPGDKTDYVKIYEYLIPKLLREYDPNTFYWPASPSSGGNFDKPNDFNRGDVHYWDVWHANVPFTAYRQFYFRYLSEFGFQSFPARSTIESFTEPEDRNIFSYVMEKHQRNNAANGKIMNYLSATFLYPTKFETLLYASQLLQAEALKFGVEHFRRNRGRCMGAVIWQLNDCWPVASWSSIDYTGRWKAAHYYAKRFFAPLLLSAEEEGLLTQDPNVNAEPYDVRKTVRFNVSNETMNDTRAEIFWSLRSADGTVKRSGSLRLAVPALTAVYADTLDFGDAALYDDYVSFHGVTEDGESFGEGTVIFSVPKHFRYKDPKLSLRTEGDEIIVSAASYAKSVEIRNADETLLLSDNYFDMDPGEKRVKVLSGSLDGLTVRSVYDIR
ncbi:MAG: glycoside hydrolase family 2 protein, partial [Lachnospiraceae bacterium]|nr:glycoside hydrolase family 2 protein [Lachnospiraceae bacterium]